MSSPSDDDNGVVASLIKLGFDIRLVHNYTVESIRELIFKWSRADHTQMDCFVCVIMSHGEEGAIFGVDKSIDLDQIINIHLN